MVFSELHAIIRRCVGDSYTFTLKREDWGFIATISRYDKRGMGSLYWYYDDCDTIYFASFRVLKRYRLNGYGKALLSLCENIAKELGFKEMQLAAIEGSSVVDMYLKLGYEKMKIERLPYDDVDMFKIWLSKTLE